MKTTYSTDARKRPANPTLNEDSVMRARKLTNDLSGVVESLLAKVKTMEATVAMWNDFNVKRGSFADDLLRNSLPNPTA